MPKGKESEYYDWPTKDARGRMQGGGFFSKLKKGLKPMTTSEYDEHSKERKVDLKAKQEARVAKRKKVVGEAKKSLKPQTTKEYKAGEGERKAKSKAKQAKRVAKRKKLGSKIKSALEVKPITKQAKAKKAKAKKGPKKWYQALDKGEAKIARKKQKSKTKVAQTKRVKRRKKLGSWLRKGFSVKKP